MYSNLIWNMPDTLDKKKIFRLVIKDKQYTLPSVFLLPQLVLITNFMKLVILLHSLYWSIHTKDESKRGTAFAFIFGVN